MREKKCHETLGLCLERHRARNRARNAQDKEQAAVMITAADPDTAEEMAIALTISTCTGAVIISDSQAVSQLPKRKNLKESPKHPYQNL